LVLASLVLLVGVGCVQRLHRTVSAPEALATVDRKAPFLKVHMRDGSLYALSPWTAEEAERRVSGTGTRYAVDRQVLERGTFSLSIDSVALFETNVARPSPSVATLAVITGITAALAGYCAADPKTCFGSCPTFYVTDGTRDVLQAEGFSASIAPSLEARDVDALFRARPGGREVRVKMVNEAYETHVVRFANLLAVPRAPNRRVFADAGGSFWSVTEPVPPSRCVAPEGDCTGTLASFDEKERWSKADSTDLATRETVDLVFDTGSEAPALVVASRQSLLPTYLLYQAFAYLGTSAGQWLAALERADKTTATRVGALAAALGGIDVLVPDGAGGWDSVATIRETGPLAADVRLIPLPSATNPVRVRLRMAKGAWRLDAVGLASLKGSVEAVRLAPAEVFAGERLAPEVRAQLLAPINTLVTFPGDAYTLVYRLPDEAERYELFLETKGYYLEWMRTEWLAEENLLRAAALFLDPAGSLRRLAPEFKRVEPQIEAAFWRSKFAGF
jgi:hypothetical protein